MNEIATVASQQEEIGIGIGVLGGNNLFGQLGKRKLGGDDTQDLAGGRAERTAIGGHGLVVIDSTLGIVDKGIDPACLARTERCLIPRLVVIGIVGLHDGGDRVAIIQGIDREITAILRKEVGLGTDRTAQHIGVETHDALGDEFQRVGTEVLFQQPGIGIGRGLDGGHIIADALDGGAQDAVRASDGFLTDEIAQLGIEDTQRQHEHGDGHQHDAQAELTGKTVAKYTHGCPPFFRSRVLPARRSRSSAPQSCGPAGRRQWHTAS